MAPIVRSFSIKRTAPHDGDGVHLAGWFSNPRKPLVTLIRRVLRGSRRSASRPERQPVEDVRGPVAKNSPRAQTRLSVSNRAALAEEYAKDVPVDELVRRFGIHRTTVHRLASQAGISVRRRGLDEPGRQKAARLYEQGMTLEEVAAELAIGDETVRSAVVACGGTIRPRGRRPARV
ncbi:hypothetical protein GCM10009626_40330 [Brachybacterium sacelli]